MRDKIVSVLGKFYVDDLGIDETIDSIMSICGISPDIILVQQWEEDSESLTGWSSWGWFYENGNIFDEVGYEIDEVLESDKFGNILKARFKHI